MIGIRTTTALRMLACILAAISLASANASAHDNGVARTPPMGWNSWNKFACDVSESLIREAADTLVSSGMKDAGYEYVVIDDCWQVGRDENGNIIPDPKRFPSGMKALADYVHSKGLKFGIYSDAGRKTCQGRPGTSGYEWQDARQYAAWGVDYLKFDWCEHGALNAEASYTLMSDAAQSVRPADLLQHLRVGLEQPWLWARNVGNLWRTTGDIQDCWDCKKDWGGMGWLPILDLQDGLESYSGPGHWNDPDMLEVGNGGLTAVEARAHFTMWCVLAAPLMAGNDIRSMTPETHDILTNKEVIAVDQDRMGLQGRRVKRDGDLDVWAKQLADGGRAIALLNRGTAPSKMSVSWTDVGYPAELSASVRDLWEKKDLGTMKSGFSADVPGHGVVLIRVSRSRDYDDPAASANRRSFTLRTASFAAIASDSATASRGRGASIFT